MIRYVLWFCAAMVGGCVSTDVDNGNTVSAGDGLSRDAQVKHEGDFRPCGIANDCKMDNSCAVPQCIEGVCVYVPEINGLSCIDSAGTKGVCVDLSCVPIGESMIVQCPGLSGACVYDSDCFTQECTSSMCVNGSCWHVAYEDGAPCIDYKENDGFYAGTCSNCVCVK